MRIVGLTGGIGAGKSTVAGLLAARGAHVIDVDSLGREVISPGGRAEQAVIARFGETVVGADGHIDRAALARRVFTAPDDLRALEAISHPAINAELDERLDRVAAVDSNAVVVLDMAILLGSRLGRDLPSGRSFGEVIVVEAPETVRLTRLIELRGMTEADARARLGTQPTDAQRRAVADHVVTNVGNLDELRREIDHLAAVLGLRPDEG